MRKVRGNRGWYQKELKEVPRGVCSLCGGKGRYKETFKHKNPIIHFCLKCEGTGHTKTRVMYKGETDRNLGLWSNSTHNVITETETDYVISIGNKGLLQMSKELFTLINY